MNLENFVSSFVKKYNSGKQMEMGNEYYDENVISHEPIEGRTTYTLADKFKRNERFISLNENMTTTMSRPKIYGNFFSTEITMISKDARDHSDILFKELCVYELKDGKIIRERFYYQLPSNLQ